jgi:hypothetical protein
MRTTRTIKGLDDVERDYEISYAVNSGCRDTRWEPGEAPSVDVSSVKLDGQPIPNADWETLGFDPINEDLENDLLEEAADHAEAMRDDAADARMDEIRRHSR